MPGPIEARQGFAAALPAAYAFQRGTSLMGKVVRREEVSNESPHQHDHLEQCSLLLK
jgi:hypothetical protein